ncbi:dTDP-glucose 4,6-dehydratase [Paenibacillus elgii]|uniref:dTDP-glucose 4,6-dehydratase n=1 Tax=Paenibacillus elgii TaxID=189691 RepID=UPI00203E8F25|nr:NAD-dependent epimerase/dehydratase family protein [Paenibacillus elgii]MCM3271409.1 NAD-dependent epimerase/dehydratase family protein [Paenibacillus elgii]
MRCGIKGSSILITGGAGFIGSHLVDGLIDAGASKIVVIDNMFLGSKNNLNKAISKGIHLYTDDAEHDDALQYIFNTHKIDIVFNCATKALNYSFLNPSNAFTTNVQVIRNLLESQRKNLFGTLCHFSTSEVYGTAVYEPMDENHPINPTTTYAAGKAAADLMLQSYVRMFNLDAFIVRPFNNYGPRQNHEGIMAGVIPRTIKKIVNGETPEIHGTGLQTRDFIYVQDTVDAILSAYNKLKPAESVNISTDGQISIKEVIEKIAEYLEYRGEIVYKPARKADVECHNASNKKIKSLISYNLTSFDKGLKETIDWYKSIFRK